MKYLRLMLKNAARNRRRTALTLLSMAVSLFLLVSLRTFLANLEGSPMFSDESALRLVTRNVTSMMEVPLPIGMGHRLEQVPGVELVSPFQWIPGHYQDPSNLVILFGIDPEKVPRIATEYHTSSAELEAFQNDRMGALVGRKVMQRFGWKLGDRVTITPMMVPFDMEVVIRGALDSRMQTIVMDVHYDYFNELLRQHLPRRADKVMAFWIKVRTPEDVPRVAAAIDAMYRNSDSPTRTETEKSFMLSFTSLLGNVKVFFTLIGAAVVFAMLLVSMNTMAMSVRERTGEIAVLKTLGFRRWQLLRLLVGESVLITLAGGLLGMLSAKLVFGSLDIYTLSRGLTLDLNITPQTMLFGMGLAVLVSVISATVPAWRAVNSSIAAALRHVG